MLINTKLYLMSNNNNNNVGILLIKNINNYNINYYNIIIVLHQLN